MSVTYYLGAGASAKKIHVLLIYLIGYKCIANFLRENWTQGDISYRFNGNTIKTDGKSDYKRDRSTQIIEEFCSELEGQLSIDTLVKIYWIQNHRSKLKVLKSVLFASIIFRERDVIDQIYLNFWATITSVYNVLDKDLPGYIDYPGTINVLSWNYDSQLEGAFSEIFPKTDSIWDQHAENSGKSIFKHTGVNFKKLNGSASMPNNFLLILLVLRQIDC